MRTGCQSRWRRLRGWPWWGQALLWIFFLPLPTAWWVLSKPKGRRQGPAGVAVLVAISWLAALASTRTSITTAGLPTTSSTTASPSGVEPASTSAEPGVTSSTTGPVATTTASSGAAGASAAVLAGLRVAPEGPRAGYMRELFPHWIDADADRCDTREEVLIAESTTQAQVDYFGCKVVAGDWFSIYDGVTTEQPGNLDVDHVVALAEAWDSGASGWDQARRQAFANDLDHPGALIAVTASSNRAKANSHPAQWRPDRKEAWCSFATDWATVKVAWNLSADQAEVDALRSLLSSCGVNSPAGSIRSTTTSAPRQVTTSPARDGGSYYANCDAARAAGAAPSHAGEPGYRPGLDGDHDGVACE